MSLSILVVEDEAVVAIDLELALEEMGHRVTGAGRLSEALDAVESNAFDLAILDVNLNGEASYPIAERLAQKGVPFVFLTGYGSEGLDQQWQASPVFQKPMQRAELASLLSATEQRGPGAGAPVEG